MVGPVGIVRRVAGDRHVVAIAHVVVRDRAASGEVGSAPDRIQLAAAVGQYRLQGRRRRTGSDAHDVALPVRQGQREAGPVGHSARKRRIVELHRYAVHVQGQLVQRPGRVGPVQLERQGAGGGGKEGDDVVVLAVIYERHRRQAPDVGGGGVREVLEAGHRRA